MAKDKPEFQPDSVFKTLASIIRLTLVAIGLAGLSVEIFRDDGLLKNIFSGMISSRFGLASIPIVLIAVFLLNRWLVAYSHEQQHSSKGDIPLYVMMAIGGFFVLNPLIDTYWPSFKAAVQSFWAPIRHFLFGI